MLFVTSNLQHYIIFFYCSDLVAELPFILMHPKPEEEDPPALNTPSRRASKEIGNNVPVDTNLIQLDA